MSEGDERQRSFKKSQELLRLFSVLRGLLGGTKLCSAASALHCDSCYAIHKQLDEITAALEKSIYDQT